MKDRQNSKKDAGFTLVETLVAMLVFAIVATGATFALSSAMRGQRQINETLEQVGQIDRFRSLMSEDLLHIVPRLGRDQYGFPKRHIFSGGITELLKFERKGRPNPAGMFKRGDLLQIEYRLQDRQILRIITADVNADTKSAPIEQILLQNIVSAKITFLNRNGLTQNFLEVEATGGEERLADQWPAAIQLDVVFGNGEQLTQLFEVTSWP